MTILSQYPEATADYIANLSKDKLKKVTWGKVAKQVCGESNKKNLERTLYRFQERTKVDRLGMYTESVEDHKTAIMIGLQTYSSKKGDGKSQVCRDKKLDTMLANMADKDAEKRKRLIRKLVRNGYNSFDIAENINEFYANCSANHKESIDITVSPRTIDNYKKKNYLNLFKPNPTTYKTKEERENELRDKFALVSIHECCKDFGDVKSVFGHFEGDTVTITFKDIYTRWYIITLVEIVSKYTITILVKDKSTETISKTIIAYMKDNFTVAKRSKFKSITFDQGKEFAFWKDIQDALGLKIYFADAGCPWQRPLNENSNRWLRERGLTKGGVLSSDKIANQYVRKLTFHFNAGSRKSLEYESPNKVFLQHLNNKF